jgi:K+-transporting ATPase ATPase C chain
MRRQLLPALLMLLIFTVITGLVYPLAVTGVAQGVFKDKADGSLIKKDGHVIGSRWIGQPFDDPKYFHPRPAADGYVAGAQGGGTYSYGSNYGPINPALVGNIPGVNITDATNPYATPDDPFCVPVESSDGSGVYEKNGDGTYVCNPDTVPQRVLAYRAENGLAADAAVPVDAVTASASGLDPHISAANARLQAPRVAEQRGMDVAAVLKLVDEYTDGRDLGFMGEPGVNVLELNLALDNL